MVEGDGNPADLTPPKVGWELGEPDVVLETPAIQVPAQGGTWKTVVRFPVDEKLAGEVNAFDIRAEDPWVDRQAILAVEKPKEPDTFRATGLEISRVIGFWGLGYRPWKLPADAGIHVEKGSVLAVQMLYHPSGTAEDGRFKIGLYFAKKPVSRRPYWATLGTDSFTITGEPRWTTLEASYTLPDTATLICIQPEARALATQVWLSSNSDPGLGERDLMHIYRWDPRWAGAYNLENPPTLGRNTILKTSIEYDNSNHTDTGLSLSEVKLAPPRAPVHFGPREADELFWVHVQLLPVK
jgi:hypothetical protein